MKIKERAWRVGSISECKDGDPFHQYREKTVAVVCDIYDSVVTGELIRTELVCLPFGDYEDSCDCESDCPHSGETTEMAREIVTSHNSGLATSKSHNRSSLHFYL